MATEDAAVGFNAAPKAREESGREGAQRCQQLLAQNNSWAEGTEARGLRVTIEA